MQVTSGQNVAAEWIYRSSHLSRVPRAGSVTDDLKYLFEGWSHRVKPAVVVISRYASRLTGLKQADLKRLTVLQLCSVLSTRPEQQLSRAEYKNVRASSSALGIRQILRYQVPNQGDETQSELAAAISHLVSGVEGAGGTRAEADAADKTGCRRAFRCANGGGRAR